MKPTPTTRTGAYPDLRALQSQVGNRTLSGMLSLVRTLPVDVQRAPDSAGWEGAETRGPGGGWNTKPKDVGSIRRIPIDGLTLGLQKDPCTERDRTIEPATGRAIVLIPSGIRLKVVRGLGDKPAEGTLTEALQGPQYPLHPWRTVLAVHQRQRHVGSSDAPAKANRKSSWSSGASPASPVPTSTPAAPTPAAALTLERIIEIATKHGLGAFCVFAALPRILRGGDSLDTFADVLVTAGMRDNVDLTDVLFDVAHLKFDGGQIPGDRADLKDAWVQLRRHYAKLAVARRLAPADTSSTAPGDATGTTAPPTATAGPAPIALDPSTVKAAKAATGAKALTEKEKQELPKEAVDQAPQRQGEGGQYGGHQHPALQRH